MVRWSVQLKMKLVGLNRTCFFNTEQGEFSINVSLNSEQTTIITKGTIQHLTAFVGGGGHVLIF